MAAQRHEISLRVLKNISRVSPPFELFYDEFKVTKCYTKTFCLCWVLRSKIAVMRCVTFSNVLYVSGLFMNNWFACATVVCAGGHVYISAWVSRFASVTEIIKYVEKLLLFACLVFSRTLCETVYKLKRVKKVWSDLKTILKTDLANLRFLSFEKGEACQSI